MNCTVQVDADGHQQIICPRVDVTTEFRVPSMITFYFVCIIVFCFMSACVQLVPAIRNYCDYGNLRVPRYARDNIGLRNYEEL